MTYIKKVEVQIGRDSEGNYYQIDPMTFAISPIDIEEPDKITEGSEINPIYFDLYKEFMGDPQCAFFMDYDVLNIDAYGNQTAVICTDRTCSIITTSDDYEESLKGIIDFLSQRFGNMYISYIAEKWENEDITEPELELVEQEDEEESDGSV